LKKFSCGSVMPGCGRVFTGVGDQRVLDQVLEHVAAAHGMSTAPVAFIELVLTHTRPYTPARKHPRLKAANPGGTQDLSGVLSPADAFPQPGVTARPVHPDVTDHSLPMNVHPLRRQQGTTWSGRSHETYRHECVLYTGTGGFLDAMVPFIRGGLARQEPVMVAIAEPRLQALRSALGRDADQVIFADMADLGRNPALIIPAWRDFTDRHSGPGRPVRGIGEPIWATRRPEEIVEAQLHEALLNVAVPPDIPIWLLCPYDTAALGGDVLDEAHRSHPVVVDSGHYRGSTRYGGVVHAEQCFGSALPEPDRPITAITFDPEKHTHVQQLLRSTAAAGLPDDRAVKLAAVIDEIAMTAARDTEQPRIRVWFDRTSVVCEIADSGIIDDPMIGRGPGPNTRAPRDRAIRIANELCDLVQVRSGTTGTTTRVHTSSRGATA